MRDSDCTLTWERVSARASDNDDYHLPKPSYGHSLSIVGQHVYLFGGLVGFSKADIAARYDEDLETAPSNAAYALNIRSNNGMEWTKISFSTVAPLPRWKHTATVLDDSRVLIFGGYHTTSHRLSDVWILDVTYNSWFQPNMQHNAEAVIKNHLSPTSWANAPSPRAGHSATLIGNLVYVFGGYGGLGYSRRDLDDLYTLNINTMQWTRLNPKGQTPEKRSGHQAIAVGNKLYVIGGTSTATQFQDIHMLDVSGEPFWTKLNVNLPHPIWNHCTVPAIAVPHCKLFSFGGIVGALNDQNRLGISSNSVAVLDCGSNKWSYLNCCGNLNEIPSARCDSAMVYDQRESKLIVFGGWSDYWHDDVHVLRVGGIVGPPYAISAVEPQVGPVTGGTELTIHGIDFIDTQNIIVKFEDAHGSVIEVSAVFVSQTQLTCISPEFLKFSSTTVNIRLSFDGMPFTNTYQTFSFFSVTDSRTCVTFGPGLLDGCLTNEEVSFIIQARDSKGIDRKTGGDKFVVDISRVSENSELSVPVSVLDQEDGRYVVTFVVNAAGKYVVDIFFNGTYGGVRGPLRGSGQEVEFVESADEYLNTNHLLGDLMIRAVKSDVSFLSKQISDLSKILFVKTKDDSWSPEEHIRVLMSVKEAIVQVEASADVYTLLIDKNEYILKYFAANEVFLHGVEESLSVAIQTWDRIKHDLPGISSRVSGMMRQHTFKIKGDIQSYESHAKEYRDEVSKADFYSFSTGPSHAMDNLDVADELHQQQKALCEKMTHVAQVFEVAGDITEACGIIDEISEILHNYRLLWETYIHVLVAIDEANSLPWENLEGDSIEESCRSLVTSLKKLPKMVKSSDAFMGLEKVIKEFVTTCPIIISLRSPAMRTRHWTELMTVVGRKFDIPATNPKMKFKDLLDVKLHEHTAEIEEITEKATKEAKHEEILLSLENIWTSAMFSMVYYKDTTIPLIRLDDEVVEQLEADQLAVQSILGSRFTHFKPHAQEWQMLLAVISDVTQILSDIQRTWTYLEPLFIHSEEVQKELPDDSVIFKEVDQHVRVILTKAWDMKLVKDMCMQRGLLDALVDLQKRQDRCKKSLIDFLDGKRTKFPRFYFIAEADLLDILSNSSQPSKVLKHVDKIFLATKEIATEITDGSTHAVNFTSTVGNELIVFKNPILLSGKVENYLSTLLTKQQRELSTCLHTAITSYASSPRIAWLMQKVSTIREFEHVVNPAQISLLVNHIIFTRQTEAALSKPSKNEKSNLRLLIDLIKQQLADLIELTTKTLSKGERQRLMCMITMDAHNRDIIDKLIEEKVETLSDFQWQSKMRADYKYLPNSPESSNPEFLISRAEFRICDACFEYGFEYLGNGPRLVITPLTDRIYVTAAQALHLKMGCSPMGPAGTGKTETTKDLASSLGKCCYVFNCSPEIDYKTMGNIFKGLSASGAWGCFDEFNRLVPEVLSVCSVQFKAVCDGMRAFYSSPNKTTTITIDGDSVVLDPSCGVFITMNPGYLGRSELPEGLKALFRPITVMSPDLILICENMLMAEGFQTAKILATKFYALYTLLSQLLSRQSHYDFGLRAVKSVLVVAGQFRRATPNLNEEDILLRALRDFNIPKIVEADQVVFFGLLNDLFPGRNPLRIADEELGECIVSACEDNSLVADPSFILKVTQLEELLQIRHCVFIMGMAGIGKSSCWKILRAAKSIQQPMKKVKVVDINPKVLPTEDLYGHINLATREWKDGLLSRVMRDLGNIPNDAPKWIVLDGDLDANWIESMNSVMDDNKMLTLACNERIPLRDHMRMIFEIRDLKYATPATVSRAGILFLSSDTGSQWRNIVSRWIKLKEVDLVSDDSSEVTNMSVNEPLYRLRELFDKYVPDSLKFFTTVLSGVVYFNEISLISSLLRLLDVMLPTKSFSDSGVESIFVFCLIWGFGSVLGIGDDGTDHQRNFSDWLRARIKNVKMPMRDSVFDYWLDDKTTKFEPWKSCPVFKSIEFNSGTMSMSEVTIPTPQTTSLSFWMNHLVCQGHHVMLAGGSGTGKTQLVNGLLSTLDSEYHTSSTINMNYFTTAGVLQASLESSLQKRTGSTYGPPGSVDLVYFIDDVNLPEVDTYGTQSALALLRQHIDYGHWYDSQKLTIKKIENCHYIAALNPTAGSFSINPRLQRHFSTFAVTMPSVASLHTIFLSFLSGHFNSQNFKPVVVNTAANLIKAALGVHKEVSDTFRKTAVNFHYEFHIRHLTNVFQGLLNSTPSVFKDVEKIVYLWLHESERVYCDGLVDQTDCAKFKQLLVNHAKKIFPQYNPSRYYLSGSGINSDALVFCHFPNETTRADIEDLVYNQALNINSLRTVLTNLLKEYNESNPLMDLVLFDDAILHIARIVRIIKQERGHALLVGVGGSGKQSLARLAGFICGYYIAQMSISANYTMLDFKADIQALYNRAGVRQEGVLFLITDNHINNERMFVYINDLLSSTNIPDLFNRDEKDSIIGSLANRAKTEGYSSEPNEVWKYFNHKVRQNLHICLSFSPMGNMLRQRARRFPAIVSCTTIDWFRPWSEQALISVGKKKLSVLASEFPEVARALDNFVPQVFLSVTKLAHTVFTSEKRHVYFTPKSYLEMIQLFQSMVYSKNQEATNGLHRLQNGIEKLIKAGDDVVELENSLKVMLSAAEEKRAIAERAAANVKQEKLGVELENEKVRVEEVKVATIQTEVSAKQADAANDLQQAEPALMRAMAALDSLDRRDLGNCRTMSKPPQGVDDVFAAVMVLLAGTNSNIIIQKNGKVREKERTWEASKKALLGNVNSFMDELKGFKNLIDEGHVPEINWKEVRQFFALAYFNPEDIEKKNSAAAGLCAWVINIVNYYDIVQLVEPKRAALKAANDQLAKANEALVGVRAQLSSLQAKINMLTEEFNAAEAQRMEALASVERGRTKLELARRLLVALGSEKARWSEGVQRIKDEKTTIVPECLLSSSYISYMGPFTKNYREQFVSTVLFPLLSKSFTSLNVHQSFSTPLRSVLSESQIAEFQTEGLPSDTVSSENAAIVVNSLRYPLLIDPQLQALNWIKRREGENWSGGRVGQKDLIERLIDAVEQGQVFIVENIGEQIEPSLLPFICRQTIKRSGRRYLVVGSREVEFNPNFRLFLHTKLSNPHYPPEIQAETTLVNFSVTQSGLEEQLLSMVVRYERNDLATQRAALIMQQNLFTIKVKQLENNILRCLAEATGDITENRSLIEELELSKKVSNEIVLKLEESRITSEKLKITSEKYRPVARRGALIFFAMNSLYKLHAYYMFSLDSFMSYFFKGISSTNNASDKPAVKYEDLMRNDSGETDLEKLGQQIAKRVKEIDENDRLTQGINMTEKILELQLSVSVKIHDFLKAGLFEEDKLIVCSLIALRILVDEGILSQAVMNSLIRTRSVEDPPPRGEDMARWIPELTWSRLKALEEDMAPLDPKFENLTEKISLDADEWEDWYNAQNIENRPMPGEFKEMTSIQQLILTRIIRPDKFASVMTSFIRIHLGDEFVAQHPFKLSTIYQNSTAKTPLLFVLYPGIDPTEWIEKLAQDKNISKEPQSASGFLLNISMGQGQEQIASDAIVRLSQGGNWIFLQNVHLMQSWLPKLEETLESLNPHPDFRVFLSTEPPPLRTIKNIPEGLLLSCITISNEPPSDIKANLSRAWASISADRIEASPVPDIFKACLFGLCFFHSVMVGRRRFNAQGWSRPYSFNMGDLKICVDVLESYLARSVQSNVIPWKDLQYLFGDIMYGGWITDFFDSRVNLTYLSTIFNERILKKGELAPKLFSPDSRVLDYSGYKAFIETSLPSESPGIYGLHSNAEVGFLTSKTEHMFKSIFTLEFGSSFDSASGQPTASVSSQSRDVLFDLLSRMPESFNIADLQTRAKDKLESSEGPFIVVLIQECSRFNFALETIASSLLELQKGINGQLNMSQSMEDLLECLMLNIVPGRKVVHQCSWEKGAWPSKKSLGPWFNDFIFRKKQLDQWSTSLTLPFSTCLPSLINPIALLTAIKQVTARKLSLPLDNMTIETHVTRLTRPSEVAVEILPDDGILVHGLLIEGARWSDEDEVMTSMTVVGEVPCGGHLCDSRPKQLMSPMPLMYIQAVQVQPEWRAEGVGYLRNDPGIYECPVYATSARGDTFVFLSTLKTLSPSSKWILAGVAILMQSDE